MFGISQFLAQVRVLVWLGFACTCKFWGHPKHHNKTAHPKVDKYPTSQNMVCKSSSFIWMLTCTAALFWCWLLPWCPLPGTLVDDARSGRTAPPLQCLLRQHPAQRPHLNPHPYPHLRWPRHLWQHGVPLHLPRRALPVPQLRPVTVRRGEGAWGIPIRHVRSGVHQAHHLQILWWGLVCVVCGGGGGEGGCCVHYGVCGGGGEGGCCVHCGVCVWWWWGGGLLHALWCVWWWWGGGLLHALWCVVVVGRGVVACIMVCVVVVGRGLLCALWCMCVWWWWGGGLLHALWCVWWWWGGGGVVCIMMHVYVVVVGRGVATCIMVCVVVVGRGVVACIMVRVCVVVVGRGLHALWCTCVWWWWGGGLLHALWCVWLGGGVCSGVYGHLCMQIECYWNFIRHTETFTITGMNLLPLGWSRVPLFRGGAEGYTAVETFVLLEGETWVALHPGDIPDSLITTQPSTPTETPEGEMSPWPGWA